MEWLHINQGPVDWILSDLAPRSRSLKVKRSKSFLQITLFEIIAVSHDENVNLAYSTVASKIGRSQRSEGSPGQVTI